MATLTNEHLVSLVGTAVHIDDNGTCTVCQAPRGTTCVVTTHLAYAVDTEPCDECGAEPGEPCNPWCTAEATLLDALDEFGIAAEPRNR